MIDAIIRLSLKNRGLVLALSALIIVYGWLALKNLPIDVLPDLNRPTVNIITEASGMAPEEVELLVSRQIELALNGSAGITRIFSSSTTGLSVVRAEFEWRQDLRWARIAVSERLELAKQNLPMGVQPFISPTSSIMGEIQMVGLTSQNGTSSLTDLRTAADWAIRPRLMAIPGVSQVTVIGGEELQAQVLVNAEKLRRKGLSILDLKERLAKISEASGGGYIDSGDKEWLIRNFARILNHEEIAETAVGFHLGQPIVLKEIADVKFAAAPRRGAAAVSGKPGVIFMIQKQPSADTLKVTALVDQALKDLKPSLNSDIQIHSSLFKQSHFIETAIGNVIEALRDGSLMVSLVLILFLFNLRTTIVTLTAIPLSLLITAIVFEFFGLTVNTMTLGGLAIAIGELVDDAVVDVENVFRRLKENWHSSNPKPVLQVTYEASREVRNSIVFATIIVVLVFVPLFALPGFEGRLFVPIGLAYVISLVASLLVSITVTPTLCSFLLAKKTATGSERESLLVRVLKAMDRSALNYVLDHPGLVIGSCLCLFVAALVALAGLGRDFLPPFNEGSAMLTVEAKPGISLEASDKLAAQVETELLNVPEVLSVGRRTGRAENDDHSAGVHSSEFEIALNLSERPRSEVFGDIRERVRQVVPPEVFISLSQPISHRLDHIISGIKAQTAIKVFGPDLRILRQSAAEIRNAVANIKGVVDLRLEGQVLIPQYKIYGMRPDLQRYGIVPGDLTESLETMLQGVPVTKLIEKERSIDIYLRLDPESRSSIDAIRDIPVRVLPTGKVVVLQDVSDIFETSGPNVLEREDLQRRIVVSFNIAGRDLEEVVNEAKARIDSVVKFPSGYFYLFDGQYKTHIKAMLTVLVLGALSLVSVFLVLFAHFRSVWISLLIMLNVPLALIGSVLAIMLSGTPLSVASIIGFITLCGIASRNGIMMISHYIHLLTAEGEKFSKEMVIRGSLERLVPVLMTAFSAILALTPLVLAFDQPGKEILHPVAIVIVGGLFTSTLLDIIATPTVFYAFGSKYAQQLKRTGFRKSFTAIEHGGNENE